MSKIQKKSITRQSVILKDRRQFKDGQALVNSILKKKFEKNNNQNMDDDCDSCGEQCFD